jgi:S1-C subfamily serine protease
VKFFSVFVLGLFLLLGFSQSGFSDELADKVRSALPKYQNAIVPIKLVIKIKMRKQEQERKVEVTGTIIDPSGLAVVSALSVDPAAVYNAYQADGNKNSASKNAMDSDVSETTIILNDGTEIDADVVLKDLDLDLAFIRPKENTKKFESIQLPAHQKPVQVLDDVFVINRLGPTEDRTPIVSTGKVRSIVKGPRTYYICDDDISKNLGCVAFALDGTPVGIFVAKKSQTSGAFSSGYSSVPIAVMRPIDDLLEVAAQAKEAKMPDRAVSSGDNDATKSK